MDRAALGALIASTLDEAERSERRADQLVKAALRRAPSLTNAERGLVGRAVHGARCWARTIDFILEDAGTPAARAATWAGLIGELGEPEVMALWPDERDAYRAAKAGRWHERLPADDVARLAIEQSVPDWLAARLCAERGVEDCRALLSAMNEPGPVWLRVNALKSDRLGLRAALEAEGAVIDDGPLPHALRVVGRLNVRGSAAWQAGTFEVQDLGSQIICAAVGAQPGERIVDACAGRGGKALALAADMTNEGELLAFDVDDAALDALGHRAARAGASVTVSRGSTLRGTLSELEGRADRVLVDAPCSSTGTLRRGPDLRWRVAEADVARYASLQRAILDEAAMLVRPGGRLVYATCSVLREENGAVADQFEASHLTWRPSALLPTSALHFAEQARASLGPHTDDTDGFFLAAWTKAS